MPTPTTAWVTSNQDKLDKPAEAEACYRHAIELDPKDAYPHNGLGNLYQSLLDRPNEAEACYRRAIELDSKYASPHNGLGCLYLEHFGKAEEAEASLRRCMELDPKNAYAVANLGQLREQQGEWPEAEDWFRKAAELSKSYPGESVG